MRKVLIMMMMMVVVVVVVKGGSLTEQCSSGIQQVTACLTYATGKAAEPTKECCNAVSSMRDKQPVCLCFFIGQAHNGSQQIKSLGIQEAKLLQLPSACQLHNASVTNCPKLLGISPTSPAAAIFMNSNATSQATSSSSSPSTTAGGDNSGGVKHTNNALIAIFGSTIVFLSYLPIGILEFLV